MKYLFHVMENANLRISQILKHLHVGTLVVIQHGLEKVMNIVILIVVKLLLVVANVM